MMSIYGLAMRGALQSIATELVADIKDIEVATAEIACAEEDGPEDYDDLCEHCKSDPCACVRCMACEEVLKKAHKEDDRCECCGANYWCCADQCRGCGRCQQRCCDCDNDDPEDEDDEDE
jgi:hypothetical protein